MYKKAQFALSKTPAPKADRIKGSKKNRAGSAKSSGSAKKIVLSETTGAVLRKKLEEFKKKYPKKKNVSIADLKAVYRRGSGAYSSTHRPTITGGKPNSRAAWSYARVNKFLQKAAGKKVKAAYVQDDDLLKLGGKITPEDVSVITYHEKEGNWLWSKNTIYVWVYEDMDAAKKLEKGEYDFLLFPPSVGLGAAFRRGYIPPLLKVWNKKFQKDIKGSDKAIGVAHGWYDENEKKLYVLMMTTHKDSRRKGVNSLMINTMRENFGLEKEDVIFDKPTEEGKKFAASGKYEEGGEMYARGGGVNKGNKPKATGDCYYAAGKIVLDYPYKLTTKIGKFNGEPYLVQAEVRGQGRIQGLRYGHAWIEDDILVYDFSNNREIILPKQLYYLLGNVKTNDPKKYRRYTFGEARERMLDTGNYGCWDIETEYMQGGNLFNNSNNMNKIQLPDSESSFENLQPILAKQGYSLSRDMKPAHSLEEIAEKHGVSESVIRKQLAMGKKHEMQHTYDRQSAETTALHHLWEDSEYYTHLKQMEMEVEAEKLENYYANGGIVNATGGTCEILDEDGERVIDEYAILNLTLCLDKLPQTKSMHYDFEKDDYKPYRKRLHKDIIYSFKKDLVCVEREQPIAILMGGSPASGKSTFLKKYAPYLLQSEIFKIDADEVRAKLPEYRGFNASQTHLETKDLVTTMLSDRNIGIPCRFDVIYDGTMNNTKSYLPLINLLKLEGYKVFIVYIDKVPIEVVKERALLRYKKSGRFVPLEVIDDFFEKGTAALEQLKKQVDGYMIIDGSNSDYKVIERGGDELPKDREYSKIGRPINITSDEVIRELKRGGEIDPDNSKIKNAVTHKSGSAGGMLVGNRHSEGGIKAINKSTGQPLEMEGGEVVITRNAVSDESKREFEGEMLTNREILSRINESGGGVSFAKGGDVPHKCACSGKEYKFGGKVMRDNEIVRSIMDAYPKMFTLNLPVGKLPLHYKKYGSGGTIQYLKSNIPTLRGFANLVNEINPLSVKTDYKNYLAEEYAIIFAELPNLLKSALLLGNQKIVDTYISRH